VTSEVINKINTISDVRQDFFLGLGAMGDAPVPEIVKFRAGSLLKDVIDRMKLKILCLVSPTDPSCSNALIDIRQLKYYAYSGVNIEKIS